MNTVCSGKPKTETLAEHPGTSYTLKDLNDLYEAELLSGRGIMGVAIENAYMTYFVDDEERADITKIANDIKDTFREIIESQE